MLYGLDFQQQFPGCLSALKILMCLSGILERIDLVDTDVKFAGFDQVEDTVGVEFQFLPRQDIVHQRGAHDGDVLGR